MIPCHICGVPAVPGWIIGFPPAPDSQKMGLCLAHNSIENRRTVYEQWQKEQLNAITVETGIAAFRAGEHQELLTIYFVDGGSLAMPCASCSVTDHESLQVRTTEGTVFFPLRQVRNYALTPLVQTPALKTPHQPKA